MPGNRGEGLGEKFVLSCVRLLVVCCFCSGVFCWIEFVLLLVEERVIYRARVYTCINGIFYRFLFVSLLAVRAELALYALIPVC